MDTHFADPQLNPPTKKPHEYYTRRAQYSNDIFQTTNIQLEIGRNLNNLPTLLNNDLQFVGGSLQTIADFHRLAQIAQNRQNWSVFRQQLEDKQIQYLNLPKQRRIRPARAKLPRNKKKRRIQDEEDQPVPMDQA